MLFYTVTVFLSAFLLFEVQPVIAKMILPWFGGASAVWSTCMLFFQMALLLGYLYAHWLYRSFHARGQAMVHSAALALSLASLPILPNPVWKTAGGPPSLRILALLAVTVGLPYFLLSSTSPLLQAWYARRRRGLPYRFFALSNLASMLALLSYPSLIEPHVSTHLQGLVWSAAYAVFTLFCGITAWRATADPALRCEPGAPAEGSAPSLADRLLWLGLSASASVLLLAVTTHLTQDVAPVPFLWVLPLSVYLLSFILCFESAQIYRRSIFLPLLAASLCFMIYRLSPYRTPMPMRAAIFLFAMALFSCCMVCHGELARLKPHPRFLTGFYVLISLGGAVGGLFVGLVAPNLFRGYYEFPIGLALCAAVVFLVLARQLWPLADSPRGWALSALAVALCCYFWYAGTVIHDGIAGYHLVARNFYGQLRVADSDDPEASDATRRLVHGAINHGEQALRDEYRRMPITYFCPDSGIGRAMRAQADGSRRIGILGLGSGTLAAYARLGDTLRIYEINPLVPAIARSQFTYLRDTPARVEIVLGDGRLSLEAEAPQQFDLLVMDAFSGDSVPVHLVTREAFRSYFRHLKPGGILAVNITNKYLDLEPVMERGASEFGRIALVYPYTPPPEDFLCFACSWTLILDRAAAHAHPELLEDAKLLRRERWFRAWTDDFSNMFSILK